jgi:hypothetical protein
LALAVDGSDRVSAEHVYGTRLMSEVKSINAILLASPQMPRHTDLSRIFEAFEGLQQKFNWLLTGDECFFVHGRPMWLSGTELTERVESGWSTFEWGVFSGFAEGVAVDPDGGCLPYADGNPSFWKPYPKPQHPLATVEIVCFESSATMLLSRDHEMARRFRAFFTDARDLDDYIDEHVRPVLRAWAVTAQTWAVGDVVTVRVVGVGQTTATVEFPTGIGATIRVKQMREAGFGPTHSFGLDEYLKAGQQVVVQVTQLAADDQKVEVEFLRMAV